MDLPSSNTEVTLLEECLEEFFSSNESDLASDSCSEFGSPSPDSIPDESNNFRLLEKSQLDKPWSSKLIDSTTDSQPPSNKLLQIPIRTLLRLKKDASQWDITLGDVFKEIFPHLRPILASAIKEALSDNTSSHCVCMSSTNIGRSGVTIPSMVHENFLFRNSHTSPFVKLNYDEEMEKIFDNPWIPDETVNRVVVPSTDPNQTLQVQQHHSTTKLQKLIRLFIFSMLCIIVFVIAGVATFVMLELDFYRNHGGTRACEGGIWLKLIRYQVQHDRFFLSSNFV